MRSNVFTTSGLLLALGAAALFSSCEIIPDGRYYDDPDSEVMVPDLNPDLYPDSIRPKKVLIEEFTGHECGNCPEASEVAHKLCYETLPDRTVLVLIHAGNLAIPASAGSGKYEVDYRIKEGEELLADFKIPAVPYALVSRSPRPNVNPPLYYIASSKWESQTRQLLGKNLDTLPEVRILLSGDYDAASRTFTGRISVKYLMDAPDPENELLSLYLVEDSVVSWQKDYRLADQNIPNYAHHDMLRMAINGKLGQPVRPDGEAIRANDRFYRTLELTIPDTYRANHCKLVAFVHNNTTHQVRQVESRYLYE